MVEARGRCGDSPLRAAGCGFATTYGSPHEVAQHSDILLTMLPNGRVVQWVEAQMQTEIRSPAGPAG